MKVLYEDPKNEEYTRWFDNDGVHDVWYKTIVSIYRPIEEEIPEELRAFLAKWTEKIKEYKETFIERYPVKLAHIEFIYKDVAYRIDPLTIKATYMSTFMRDEPYEVEWDSLFEEYQREIRDDLRDTLGVTLSRYIGFLD